MNQQPTTHSITNQSINQSKEQSNNQSINRTINQSIDIHTWWFYLEKVENYTKLKTFSSQFWSHFSSWFNESFLIEFYAWLLALVPHTKCVVRVWHGKFPFSNTTYLRRPAPAEVRTILRGTNWHRSDCRLLRCRRCWRCPGWRDYKRRPVDRAGPEIPHNGHFQSPCHPV